MFALRRGLVQHAFIALLFLSVCCPSIDAASRLPGAAEGTCKAAAVPRPLVAVLWGRKQDV
eukprot:10739614-Alexandrium_andersonii.AAC.1